MRLWKSFLLILSVSPALIFNSCQKEISNEMGSMGGGNGSGGGNNTSDIIGDYDFAGLSADTYAEVTVSDPSGVLKSVTVSSYNTQNNKGTVKITSSDMIMTGISYDINTTANNKIYLDNVLVSNTDQPFVISQPPYDLTAPYVKNTADSITVTGPLGFSADVTGNGPSGPTGAKISWVGDTLLLKVSNSVSETITQGGVPADYFGTVAGFIKLKKK